MDLFEKCAFWEKTRTPFALVTIIGSSGTVSRREGRMAVTRDGVTVGTVGGGKQEHEAKCLALKALEEGRNIREKIKVRDKGEIEVMVDVVVEDKSVFILGCGHVGRALYEVFSYLGWRVTVGDVRKELLDEEFFSSASIARGESFSSLIDPALLDSRTAFISTIPEANQEILDKVLETPVFYIGLLSSRKRYWGDDSRIHSPMGLDDGGKTPKEIAISALSEVMAAFNGRSGERRRDWRRKLVVVRGAGDLATGTIVRLHNAGYKCIALETDRPTVIRRTVSFADCVYEGTRTIEGVECRMVKDAEEALELLSSSSAVPLIVDKEGKTIEEVHPGVVVDAIIAKKNLGTTRSMAPLTVALGPGFQAGVDVDVVIETMRGHNLGRLIYSGSALPNTGTPGIIGGKGKERVIHSSLAGVFKGAKEIGDIVEEGETVAYVDGVPQKTTISGRLRGLLHDGIVVPEHFKIADVDPRGAETDHTTISDKARALGGAVLEALDAYFARKEY